MIVLFALFSSREFANFDPKMRLTGNESEWISSSAQWVSQSLQEYGYLPLWQPYWSRGEPSIDSPFVFALHPVNILPTLLVGYPNGIKVSIIISFIITGVGGWVMGRAMGLNAPARLFLGIILLAKGPTYATLSKGYFQLGVTQAYIPWALAAAIYIGRSTERRWPVVLLAISLTMIFWAGNIYYTLPVGIMVVLIIAFYLVRRRQPTDQVNHRFQFIWDSVVWRRMLTSLVLTVGLAAVTLIPIFVNQRYIGGHNKEQGGGTYSNPVTVLAQLFSNEHFFSNFGTWHENYYIFTLPLWFALLIFIILPQLQHLFPGTQRFNFTWRFWIAGFISLIFFTLWGTGNNPIITWMYENLPLIGQWRAVGRMLTITSFWVVVFAALRIDSLWKWLNPTEYFQQWLQNDSRNTAEVWLRSSAGIILAGVAFLAGLEVATTRVTFGALIEESEMMNSCVTWLRLQHPGDYLSVYTRDYYTASTFMRNHVRLSHINVDYDPKGLTSDFYLEDLTEAMPEFMIPYYKEEQDYWVVNGYSPVPDSPKMEDGIPCIWRNPNTLAYSFTIPIKDMLGTHLTPQDIRYPLDPKLTSPINVSRPNPALITMNFINSGTESLVVVIQEVSWPGWTVTINGKPAVLQSVGQLIGVTIPPSGEVQTVVFQFTDRILIFSAMITIATGIFCILYLLRVDRLLNLFRKNQATGLMVVPQPDIQNIEEIQVVETKVEEDSLIE
ncbi:MAG TPA: hypothetical protein VHL11_11495 [Phototrophicaceae bacterium]|nr:hypothetical protein [Phototrophicaceae bacterium]